jgi:integrase
MMAGNMIIPYIGRGLSDHAFCAPWEFTNRVPRPEDQLPRARLHDLRHLHATTLLLSGVPVHVVAARRGHADPVITLRVYAHVIRNAESAAADIFAQPGRAS